MYLKHIEGFTNMDPLWPVYSYPYKSEFIPFLGGFHFVHMFLFLVVVVMVVFGGGVVVLCVSVLQYTTF